MPIAWKAISRRLVAEVVEGDCFGWAAQLAYGFFFALFPALLFLVSLASVLPVRPAIDRGLHLAGRLAPGDVLSIAREQLVEITAEPRPLLVGVSFAVALWSASAVMTTVISTLNYARHRTERRSWLRVRATAIALAFGLGLTAAVTLVLVMVGPVAAAQVAGLFGLSEPVLWVWAVVRWPMAFALAVAAIAVVYRYAPDAREDRKWVTPGAVGAAVLWLLVSIAFKWFVIRVGRYQETYGAIGGVMVMLSWFYLCGLAIVMGAHLDTALRHVAASHD